MKMARTILTMVAAMAATVGYAGDSVPFRLDTVATSTGVLADSITLTYDASWIGGDVGATVVIADNGIEIGRKTGVGEFVHSLSGSGRHELTYTTLIDDEVQEEVYGIVVYKGKYTVHFESNGGEGAMEDYEVGIGKICNLPQGTFTKDGHFILGWALTPDGEAALLDGDSTLDIESGEGETVTLYAVWHEGKNGGSGLSAKYYDISSSGYSTWTQSEAAMTNYFASLTPTLEANTIDWGDSLSSGMADYGDQKSQMLSVGMTGLDNEVACRFHGKYANDNSDGFSALLEGNLTVDVSGEYAFVVLADDNLVLYIDENRVCAASWSYVAQGHLSLEAGTHRIAMAFREGSGRQGFNVQWKKPGDTAYSPLPQSILSDGSVFAYAVCFDSNGGNGAMSKKVYASGDDVTLSKNGFARNGFAFVGWATEADGPVVCADGETLEGGVNAANGQTITLYARWAQNQYSIHFDANGGEGAMEPQWMTVNTAGNLAECSFSRAGYAFAGWATEPDGEVVYADADEVVDLAYAQNAAVMLYAVWEAREWTLADYIDATALEPVNDFEAAWTPDWTTFKVGGVSLRSGAIMAAEEGERTVTTLTATIVGEGSGSFWWKVSCEEMDEAYDEWYDYAVFTIDGVEIAKIAGETDWEQVEFAVTGAGAHTLAWTFTRDDYDEDETAYENVAWVDGVVWTPKPVTVTFADGGAAEGEAPEAVVKYASYELTLPGAGTLANGAYQFKGWTDGETTYEAGSTFVFPAADVTLTAVWELKVWTLAEAVDAAALSFTTGGNADWSVDASNGFTNGVSAKSGAVVNGQSSWIETTVSGAGTLVFRWSVMGGIYRNNPFAYAKVEVDGVQKAQEHATDGWKEQAVEIGVTGAHTIRWTYLRTSARSADGDCAWLDAVMWTPSEGAAEGAVVEVNGVAVAFEAAEDGWTRTAAVAAGTKAEDIKVVVGGVDVTAGFKVAVEGTTATVALKGPYEVRRVEDNAPYQDNGDGNVTLNVEVVPGLYYAADSAATIEALRRPGAATPAKAGDALVAPKQGGAQGFYKVWVSDAPIEAE